MADISDDREEETTEDTKEKSEIESEYELSGKAEMKLRFIEMRGSGATYRKIAEELGVSKSTVCNWSNTLQEEVARMKAFEMDALMDEFCVSKESRIRLLGEQLKRLQEEFGKRDLSSIPTDKLLGLMLRYAETLQHEYSPQRPRSDRQMSLDKSAREFIEIGMEAELPEAGMYGTGQNWTGHIAAVQFYYMYAWL